MGGKRPDEDVCREDVTRIRRRDGKSQGGTANFQVVAGSCFQFLTDVWCPTTDSAPSWDKRRSVPGRSQSERWSPKLRQSRCSELAWDPIHPSEEDLLVVRWTHGSSRCEEGARNLSNADVNTFAVVFRTRTGGPAEAAGMIVNAGRGALAHCPSPIHRTRLFWARLPQSATLN